MKSTRKYCRVKKSFRMEIYKLILSFGIFNLLNIFQPVYSESYFNSKLIWVEDVGKVLSINCTDCRNGWVNFESACYLFIKDYRNWDVAKESCEFLDSHLVDIFTEKENKFLAANVGVDSWTGGKSKHINEQMIWDDGTHMLYYTNFASNQQSVVKEDCMSIEKTTGNWKKISCDLKLASVCKYNKENGEKTTEEETGISTRPSIFSRITEGFGSGGGSGNNGHEDEEPEKTTTTKTKLKEKERKTISSNDYTRIEPLVYFPYEPDNYCSYLLKRMVTQEKSFFQCLEDADCPIDYNFEGTKCLSTSEYAKEKICLNGHLACY